MIAILKVIKILKGTEICFIHAVNDLIFIPGFLRVSSFFQYLYAFYDISFLFTSSTPLRILALFSLALSFQGSYPFFTWESWQIDTVLCKVGPHQEVLEGGLKLHPDLGPQRVNADLVVVVRVSGLSRAPGVSVGTNGTGPSHQTHSSPQEQREPCKHCKKSLQNVLSEKRDCLSPLWLQSKERHSLKLGNQSLGLMLEKNMKWLNW